jgi:hypothetical protein
MVMNFVSPIVHMLCFEKKDSRKVVTLNKTNEG